MKRLLGGLFITAGAVVLAVGVLACVQGLLSTSPRRRRSAVPTKPDAVNPQAEPVAEPPKPRNFSIKRTKSEVGFVYWILEGFGRYKCYVLCDSWEEAVEQAKIQMEQVDSVLAASKS